MKKYFLSIVALAAMLFATSCQESLVEPQMEGPTTFTVQLPDAMGTKAFGDEASTNATINRLYVEVYSENGENLIYEPTSFIEVVNGQATFTANLIQDQKYDIIFWAQKDDAYTTTDLRKIPMTNRAHNVDNGAAFFAFLDNFIPKGVAQPVELKRPFAQLNLGTTLASLNDTDLSNDLVLSQSYIKVENVAPIFNTVTGMGEGTVQVEEQAAEFPFADVPTIDLVVNGTTYKYVSMDYLPIAGDEQALVTVTAKIKLTTGEEIDHIFTNVPVRENYRTNIIGNLISSTTDFNVTIEESWAGEDENYPDNDLENLYFAASNGGEVTLSQDIKLNEQLVITANMVINMNGKTISGDWHKNDGAIIKNNGNLKLVGGTIESLGENGGSAVQNNGTMIIEEVTLNGAQNANGGWPSYTVNNTGELTINNTKITSYHGAVSSYGDGAVVTLNNSEIDMAGIEGFTSHGIYTYNGGKVVVNGGTYANKATDQASSGASVINGAVEVNAGTFSGRIENYYGTPVLKGGTYSVKPNNNFIANGYKTIEEGGKYYVVENDVDIVVDSYKDIETQLKVAIQNGKTEITIDAANNNIGALNYTLTQALVPAGTEVTIKNAIVEGRSYGNGANGDVIFENCVFTNSGAYSIHFDNGSGNVTFKNCILYGWNSFGSSLNSVSFYNSELYGNGTYALIRSYVDLYLENCYFDITKADHQDVYSEGVEVISPAKMVEINCEWVVSTQEQLINAATNSSKVYLTDGEYEMPMVDLRGKKLTLVGSKDAIINASGVDARNQFVTGATLAFEGLTLNFGTANYMGFANTASLTYKDCDINGLQFLYGNASFEGCNFNSNGAEHSVWTYGAKEVNFTDCDFTYGDRCINCYNDNDVVGGKQVVNFTNCKFATENTASQGAVEINSCFFSVGIEVNLTSCTAPAHGQMAYVSPWDSTNGSKTTINIK